jgi:hypothetical protein
MKPGRRGIAAIPLIAALLVSACGGAVSDEHETDEPVTIEHLEGSDVARLTLTQQAAERLDIQTAPVEADGSRMLLPSAAVFVEPDGTFWVYTNPESLVFVRHKISVDHDDGNHAFVTDGPPPGTQVVTVGVPELLGAEYEIGH